MIVGVGADIAPLVTVAIKTSIRKIRCGSCAPVLFTDDVIDFAAKRRIVFVQKAVFTAACRSGSHQTAQLGGDVGDTHEAVRLLGRDRRLQTLTGTGFGDAQKVFEFGIVR